MALRGAFRCICLPMAALLLAACGYRAPMTRLEPPDPALTPAEQKAARAAERDLVASGLEVPADARPQRVDDLTVKLDMRRDDPFSLPPEGTTGGKPVPFPGDPAQPPAAAPSVQPAQTAPEPEA